MNHWIFYYHHYPRHLPPLLHFLRLPRFHFLLLVYFYFYLYFYFLLDFLKKSSLDLNFLNHFLYFFFLHPLLHLYHLHFLLLLLYQLLLLLNSLLFSFFPFLIRKLLFLPIFSDD